MTDFHDFDDRDDSFLHEGLADDAEHPVIPWLTYPRRRYLYRLLLALTAFLVTAGVLTAEVAVAAGGLLAAALGTATAVVFTPRD